MSATNLFYNGQELTFGISIHTTANLGAQFMLNDDQVSQNGMSGA